MVVATSIPNMLRVSFIVAETGPRSLVEPNLRRLEIVCFVRPTANGDGHLEILYDCHCWYHRTSPSGAWLREQPHRQVLNQTTMHQIEVAVMTELWDKWGVVVKTLPGHLGDTVEEAMGKG